MNSLRDRNSRSPGWKENRHITSEFGGEFVIWKAVDGHFPNPQSLTLLAPNPVSAAKVEHRQIVIGIQRKGLLVRVDGLSGLAKIAVGHTERSEGHTSELQSLMRIQYYVLC